MDIESRIEALKNERSIIETMNTDDEIEKKVAEYRENLHKEFKTFVEKRLIAIDAKLEVYNELLADENDVKATESEAGDMTDNE